MFNEFPNNEDEMQEKLNHCYFCTMWDEYNKTCGITGDEREHDHEKCDLFDKDEEAEKRFRKFCEENEE